MLPSKRGWDKEEFGCNERLCLGELQTSKDQSARRREKRRWQFILLFLACVGLTSTSSSSRRSKMDRKISLRLILFTCERYSSFVRLFNSIESSLPSLLPTAITIAVDSPGTRQESSERSHLLRFLDTVRSKHGPVEIIYRKTHFGLKQNVLEGWNPIQRRHEYAIFLEDDVEVSPLFLYLSSKYVASLHPFPKHVIGISLFNDRVSQQTGERIVVPTGCAFRLYKQAQSWGAIYSALHWSEFLGYVDTIGLEFDPIISEEQYMSNKWSHESSWKKYLLHFMYYRGKYMVFPSFPNNKSITTHHVERSDHFPQKPSLERLNNELRPVLLEVSDLPNMALHPDFHRMPLFDMSHKLVSGQFR